MSENNSYLKELKSTLIHWCDARKNLSKEELDENTRCAIDLIEIIEKLNDNKLNQLKKSYTKGIDVFNKELLKLDN